MMDLITVNELCQVLKVTRHWVYAQVKHKRIPHYHVGKLLRFSLPEIRKYLEETHRKVQD